MPNWKKVIVSGSDASLNSLNVSSGITGSLLGTASYATNALTASYVATAQTASYVLNAISASYAATASSANSFVVRNSLTASGLRYPTTDGAYASQALQTDASGNLSFGDVSTTFDTIYNAEATTLVKGTPVYVSGSQGANPKVYIADAANANKMPVVYIVSENITSGNTGRGITLGHIEGIDLTGYAPGTSVYVAAGGGWTSTRPTGSNVTIQFLGLVTKEGSGGKGLILNPGSATLPNIQTGYVWVGDSNSYPTALSTSSLLIATASYALTASSADNFTVRGTLTAQTLVVQTITSSINFITGSTRFGTLTSNTHQFTGSVSISGSLNINGSTTSTSFTGSLLGTASNATNALTASFVQNAQTASYVLNAVSASFASTASFVTTAQTASFVLNAVSASFASTASFVTTAQTASFVQTAQTASYVLNAVSASFASTASFVTLAQTASYVLNAISASYALSSSFASTANSASYALTATTAATASYATNLTVASTLTLDATLTDYATVASSIVGSNNLFTQNTSSYTSAFFKYTAANGSNTRAGEVIAAWNGTTTTYTDFSTVDIGDTSPVTASISIVTGQVQFNIQTNSSGWRLKSLSTFM
jgi:hypothetical protein